MPENGKPGRQPRQTTITLPPSTESLAPRRGIRLTIAAAKRLLSAAGDELTLVATVTPGDGVATIDVLGHVLVALDSARKLVGRALLSAADPILLEEGARMFAKDEARRRREDAA